MSNDKVLSTDKSSKPHVKYRAFTPCGTVNIPPSKSDVHREIICAALSRGKCRVAPVALSNDIRATIGVIEAMGAKTQIESGVLTIDGTEIFEKDNLTIDCGESGSALRFFIPSSNLSIVNFFILTSLFFFYNNIIPRTVGCNRYCTLNICSVIFDIKHFQ